MPTRAIGSYFMRKTPENAAKLLGERLKKHGIQFEGNPKITTPTPGGTASKLVIFKEISLPHRNSHQLGLLMQDLTAHLARHGFRLAEAVPAKDVDPTHLNTLDDKPDEKFNSSYGFLVWATPCEKGPHTHNLTVDFYRNLKKPRLSLKEHLADF